MKTFYRPVQAFLPPDLHCALKINAARADTTIDAIVRNLIEDHCSKSNESVLGQNRREREASHS